MKTRVLLLAMLLIPFTGIRAQSPILVEDDSITIGNSTMPGFSVVIPEVEYNETLKSWTKLLESGTKSKAVEEDDGIFIFGARIKSVSENPVNVYSKMWDGDTAVNLDVAIEMSKDVYTGNAERGDVRSYLFDFAKEQYLNLASNQLKDQEKILRELERDLNSLEKEKSRMEESIRKNNELISSERDKLVVLNNELSLLSPGMAANDPVDSDSEAYKEREKLIKQKNKEIRSSEKKIGNAEKENEKSERAIPDNMEFQVDARNKVSEQQAVVRRYEDKLETIKKYKL